jgi:hypothetical protein
MVRLDLLRGRDSGVDTIRSRCVSAATCPPREHRTAKVHRKEGYRIDSEFA